MVQFFVEILSLKGHLNQFIGQKGGFYLVVEFHREGYMAAACFFFVFFNTTVRFVVPFHFCIDQEARRRPQSL